MTEDEMDLLAEKIAARLAAKVTTVTVNLSGSYAPTKDDLAKSVTAAIRDAVRRGQIPRNALTAI